MTFAQQFYLAISNIPLFVWPLFVVLMLVGLQASRSREVPVALYYGLPFIGLAVIPTLTRLGLSPAILIPFMAAYGLGAFLGFRYQRTLILGYVARQVSIKGEWITMAAVMGIFLSKFVLGTLNAVKPEWATDPVFLTLFLSVVGICSGSFLGRSAQVIRSSRPIAV